MKICDLSTGSGRLQQAFSRLKERWAETGEHWNDAASREFEKNLREIPSQLQLTMAAVHRLREVLEKAERDCGDEDGRLR